MTLHISQASAVWTSKMSTRHYPLSMFAQIQLFRPTTQKSSGNGMRVTMNSFTQLYKYILHELRAMIPNMFISCIDRYSHIITIVIMIIFIINWKAADSLVIRVISTFSSLSSVNGESLEVRMSFPNPFCSTAQLYLCYDIITSVSATASTDLSQNSGMTDVAFNYPGTLILLLQSGL